MATPDVTTVRVKSLEQLVERGQVWGRMAEKYGVTNPVPPWKSSLDGMCDALDECATVLPTLTRREEEDRLSEHQYAELPFPDIQLHPIFLKVLGLCVNFPAQIVSSQDDYATFSEKLPYVPSYLKLNL
jgi:hypothetical protein